MEEEVITITEASRIYGLAPSTLAQAAREGRLEARKAGGTWLTSHAAMKRAIGADKLRPRDPQKIEVLELPHSDCHCDICRKSAKWWVIVGPEMDHDSYYYCDDDMPESLRPQVSET